MADDSAGGAETGGGVLDIGTPQVALWRIIRQLWIDPNVSVREITRRTGVSRHRIAQRVKQEGWPARPAGSPTFAPGASLRAARDKRHAPIADLDVAAALAEAAGERPAIAPPAEMTRLPDDLEALLSRLDDTPDSDAVSRLEHQVAVRILRACCLKLVQLEMRMTSGAVMKAPDSERHTKEMTAMTTNMEKGFDLLSGRRGKRGDTNSARPDAADVERLRREIAERLERIQAQRHARGGSGDPAG